MEANRTGSSPAVKGKERRVNRFIGELRRHKEKGTESSAHFTSMSDRRAVVVMSPDQPTHLHKAMCPNLA
ncbi:hypothetical protein Leryth_022785 [Lithospermum erythrorhizon]|nr:hypothetical protein Leryth_022785 [Lithospermum erythrorhizon]